MVRQGTKCPQCQACELPVHASTALAGLGLTVGAFVVYWLSNWAFDAGRGDLFYLADAFVHGRVWIETALGPYDVIYRDGHVYVPFAPFPAIVLAPLVALIGGCIDPRRQLTNLRY